MTKIENVVFIYTQEREKKRQGGREEERKNLRKRRMHKKLPDFIFMI